MKKCCDSLEYYVRRIIGGNLSGNNQGTSHPVVSLRLGGSCHRPVKRPHPLMQHPTVTTRFSLDLFLIIFICVCMCLYVISCLCVYFGGNY